jgi:hypothetical protein
MMKAYCIAFSVLVRAVKYIKFLVAAKPQGNKSPALSQTSALIKPTGRLFVHIVRSEETVVRIIFVVVVLFILVTGVPVERSTKKRYSSLSIALNQKPCTPDLLCGLFGLVHDKRALLLQFCRRGPIDKNTGDCLVHIMVVEIEVGSRKNNNISLARYPSRLLNIIPQFCRWSFPGSAMKCTARIRLCYRSIIFDTLFPISVRHDDNDNDCIEDCDCDYDRHTLTSLVMHHHHHHLLFYCCRHTRFCKNTVSFASRIIIFPRLSVCIQNHTLFVICSFARLK